MYIFIILYPRGWLLGWETRSMCWSSLVPKDGHLRTAKHLYTHLVQGPRSRSQVYRRNVD